MLYVTQQDDSAKQSATPEPKPGRGGRGWVIPAAIGVAVAAIGIGWYITRGGPAPAQANSEPDVRAYSSSVEKLIEVAKSQDPGASPAAPGGTAAPRPAPVESIPVPPQRPLSTAPVVTSASPRPQPAAPPPRTGEPQPPQPAAALRATSVKVDLQYVKRIFVAPGGKLALAFTGEEFPASSGPPRVRWGTVATIDPRSGKVIYRTTPEADVSVQAAAFSRDGRTALLYGVNNDSRGRASTPYCGLWEVGTAREVSRVTKGLQFDGSGAAVALSADGGRALTGSMGSCTYHDPAKDQSLARYELRFGVSASAFSPDARYAAFGGSDDERNLRLWNVESAREILRLEGHPKGVTSVSFSPNGRLLLSTSWDGTVRVWDQQTGKQVRRLDVGAPVAYAAFAPDGRRVVTVGCVDDPRHARSGVHPGNDVRVWDGSAARELGRFTAGMRNVFTATFTADGSEVVCAGSKPGNVIDRIPAPRL